MTEQAHETTETQSAVKVSDHGGVLMRISRGGLWVNPDIPADDCAQRVLESLRPLLSHTINTEVNIQVARLAAERDKAKADLAQLFEDANVALDQAERLRAEVEQLTQALEGRKATNRRLVAERNAARAEVERLQSRDKTDWAKIAREKTDTIFRMMSQRDEAIAEVRRLKAEVELLRANGQGMSDSSASCKATLDTSSAQANASASLTSSRPTDEDIWREAFMSQLHDRYGAASELAEVALAGYRKRWPR